MDLKTLLNNIDGDLDKEEQLLFGTQRLTPTHQEILKILEEQPMLVQPTLNWLRDKKAHLSALQLLSLYNKEELKAMYTKEEWELFKQRYNVKE